MTKLSPLSPLSAPSPWHSLPTVPDFILAEDLERIRHHRNFANLHLNTLPGQFAGGLNTAEVVFLALNPGSHETDVTVNLQLAEFIELNRDNHIDPYGSSFYYLNDSLEQTAVYAWWARILKQVLLAGVAKSALHKKIMLINYFPYHSVGWKSLPTIASQQFAFEIVREAIRQKKVIVIMRSKELWFKAVPELRDYEAKMIIKNPRNPSISFGNLSEENFNTLLSKLQ